MRKLILLLLGASIVANAFGPPCYFNFPPCEQEECGIGCTPVSLGPNQYGCYTNGSMCCLCIGWDITCECTFGEGNGHGSEHRIAENAYCDEDDKRCRDLNTGNIVWGYVVT
jgi:hypothetical protein